MTLTTIEGTVAAGFEPLADVFADTMALSHGHGAGLHIRVDGRPVVDLWSGWARTGEPWTADTPSVIFSCTKGLVSILIGELVRDGVLDLDERVSTYWPEFTGHGKDDLRVRQLLAHRAGLPLIRESLDTDDILDWDRMVDLLAREKPFFAPGSAHVYHPMTFGWLAGELVRRASGRSVGEFFAERIARPLGADAWIGVPDAQLGRVAKLTSSAPDAAGPVPVEVSPDDADDLAAYGDQGMTMGNAISPRIEDSFNETRIRQGQLPGAGGVASARALATIWSATVSDNETVRLLDEQIIHDMRTEQSSGMTVLGEPGPWHRWGSGFMLNSESRPFLSDTSFGHDGLGGQVAFADETAKVGFGYVTNDLQPSPDARGRELVHTLRRILDRA
ncbi:serine hydrolase domain-containing protein [Leifsonia sp. NPDC058230]|uniref:serine hydrolase domain-containing protein n=1 Tax=Leifsonia sp. NPDC058230 TaxID=3346391 RepID=UPI0036D95FDD